MEEKEMIERLSNELNKFNFNRNSIGYQYLVNAIYLTLREKKYAKNLNQFIYPMIADKYDTKPNNVSWCISKTLNDMYIRTESRVIEEYFCLYDGEGLPSPKIFVMCVARNVLQDEEMEYILY